MPGDIQAIRELTRAEVNGLSWGNRMGGPTINDIRYWHHQMARLLAEGASVQAVADSLGRSYNRVWVLSRDPLMMELIAEYLVQFEKEHRDNLNHIISKHEEASRMMVDIKTLSMSQLRDYLEGVEAGVNEPLAPKVLLAIMAETGDRSGHGKVQTNLNINTSMDTRLELANIRSNAVRQLAKATEGKVIELRSAPVGEFGTTVELGAAEPMPPPPPRLRRI